MTQRTPDLSRAVEDPNYAREYVRDFNWGHEPPEYIPWGIDQKVYLNDMTDAEAVFAAKAILREIVIPKAVNEHKLEKWEH